ncbi:hypothetical protein HER10_EVM0012967 [Colletotrichum scovillei]|uniref:Uncharacterized protein n=1 Tax=Colletotrichum scovillei TaxID=1209932 RepID=A0A9P7R4U3_9PEZI|nr:uncharacterized protein HER10_EVM0012967 [Colletotrichum scovillei]KAF4782499.1 hypothetical protein HER10_EVM0012967 [Colletotrichum scovillei]KAG7050230.1 hypothetical protein JMJ77_0012982 [Colletotrichum scovillei]KAG7069270.1 hypothetical protein JMJ76_0002943 [Colletotrichum scovillei]KAG7073184.1 hypothetical protein JMJ78_0014163 [Colletotrichum scovillei]
MDYFNQQQDIDDAHLLATMLVYMIVGRDIITALIVVLALRSAIVGATTTLMLRYFMLFFVRHIIVYTTEVPYIIHKKRWTSFCRRYQLPRNVARFGSFSYLCMQFSLFAVEAHLFRRWRQHRLDGGANVQGTGVALAAIITSITAYTLRQAYIKVLFLWELMRSSRRALN